MCTPGGYYFMQIIDYVTVCLLNNLIALLFLIATLWVYGVKEFTKILTVQIGCYLNKLAIVLMYFFAIILPSSFIILLIQGIIVFDEEFRSEHFHYPPVMLWSGRILVISLMVLVFTKMVYAFFTAEGNTWRQKFR